MGDTKWDRVWELFYEALDLEPEARGELLNEECGDDDSLREEVEGLLAGHDDQPAILDQPPPVLLTGGGALSAADLAGKQIDHYRIGDAIGEGGMGIVYRSEQTGPIKRPVALKVIKLGMDTAEVVRRFESERQALALLNHPGISTVYDCGATEQGRPYFVMELVEGMPITAFCDRQRLDTRARIDLFIEVCEAVQHAHRKGIIHRDLKPSNILVSAGDAGAFPKVIDFGVAKAVDRRLTEHSLFTEAGKVIGTPEYMSPEQAEMQADIDTQTDVYSLGVVLYELLVGTLPHDFSNKSYSEIQKAISGSEPPRPSVRVSTLSGDADAVATSRNTDAASLARELRGELDWVVVKALEKNRARRYGSVADFGADLRRFLNNEPVSAGPPSASYRARKFVQRHRAGVAAGATVAATMVAAVVVSSWMAMVASEQRALAVSARDEAQTEAATTAAINDYMLGVFGAADPWTADPAGAVPRDAKVIDVLERAVAGLDDGLHEQPVVEAAVRGVIAKTYLNLTMYDEAEEQTRKTIEIRTAELGAEHPRTLEATHNLGVIFNNRGEYDDAEEVLSATAEARRRVLGADDVETLNSEASLAAVYLAQGEVASARELLAGGLDSARRLFGDEHRITLRLMNDYAFVLARTGSVEEASTVYSDSLVAHREFYGDDHPATLAAMANAAAHMQSAGAAGDAEDLHVEVVQRSRRVLGPTHEDTLNRLNNLGALYFAQDRLAEAETLFGEVLSGYRETVGDRHPLALVTTYNLIRCVAGQERWQEAYGMFQDFMPWARELLPPGHFNLALFQGGYGETLTATGRYQQAEAELVPSFEAIRERLGDEHMRTRRAAGRLIELYDAAGTPEKAAPYRELAGSGP